MKNINFNLDGFEIKQGFTFENLDFEKLQAIGFINEESKFYKFSDISEVNQIVFLVTRTQLNSNLLNLLFVYFQQEILDFKIDLNGFWVKLDSDKNYSESEFDLYHDDIINLSKSNNLNEDSFNSEISKIGALFLNLIPFDFKFEKVAQEYFENKKIQKFKVVTFFDQEEIDDYEKSIEELKIIDHRYIGLNQNLFMMIPDSPGNVFWLPKGWVLYKNLENFIRKYGYIGFQEVKTPLVMSNSFWIKSGHMASFKKNMMFINMGDSNEDDSALKPMNCPAHIEIFKQKNRSYKELPFRIAEIGCCHRYEPSGSLLGLMRVRSLTQDDGHVFCTRDQIFSETSKFLKDCLFVYKKLDFNDVKIILSTKPDNALGEEQDWEIAEQYLKQSLEKLNLNFEIAQGEGAFYGPKIEMHVKDSLKRSWQLGTIQLDFVLPERFMLEYTTSNNEKGKICMLHRAILGSLERFVGVLLEHTKGHLPLFLAPVQIIICTIVSQVNEYAQKVYEKLNNLGILVKLDDRPEKLQVKIRDGKLAKIPMFIIIGKQEMDKNLVKLQYKGEDYLYKFEELEKILRIFNEI